MSSAFIIETDFSDFLTTDVHLDRSHGLNYFLA